MDHESSHSSYRPNILPGHYGNKITQMYKVNPKNRNIQLQNDRKKKALQEIDNIKFGWFHVRAILVSGIGFFTV